MLGWIIKPLSQYGILGPESDVSEVLFGMVFFTYLFRVVRAYDFYWITLNRTWALRTGEALVKLVIGISVVIVFWPLVLCHVYHKWWISMPMVILALRLTEYLFYFSQMAWDSVQVFCDPWLQNTGQKKLKNAILSLLCWLNKTAIMMCLAFGKGAVKTVIADGPDSVVSQVMSSFKSSGKDRTPRTSTSKDAIEYHTFPNPTKSRPEKAVESGYLKKKGRFIFFDWSPRYFVLSDTGKFYYSESKECKYASGVFSLKGLKVRRSIKHPEAFELSHSDPKKTVEYSRLNREGKIKKKSVEVIRFATTETKCDNLVTAIRKSIERLEDKKKN